MSWGEDMLKRFHLVAMLVEERLLTPAQAADVINASAAKSPKEFTKQLDKHGLVVEVEDDTPW